MYDPTAFDEIREEHFGKPSKIEKAVFWFCIAFVVAVCSISLLFASKASALETLGTSDYSRAKTGWDSLATASIHGDNGQGMIWQSSISDGLNVYGYRNGPDRYNDVYRVNIGDGTTVALTWWGNNGQDGQNGRNCGGNCWFSSYNFGRMSVNRIPIGDYSDLEVLIQTEHYGETVPVNHRWRVIAKNDGSVAWFANFSDYYTMHNGMLWQAYQNGGDFVFRRMNNDGTWTDMGTLGTPVDYVAPGLPPRCVETNAYTGNVEPVCFYEGQDGNPYAVFLFGTVTALWRLDTGAMTGGGWQNYLCEWLPGCNGSEQPAIEFLAGMRPISVLEPNTDNILSVWDKWPNTPQFGALVTANISIAGFYESETDGLIGVSGFVNPKMYLIRNNGTIGIHDISCVQPGFETCGPYNGGYACQASNGAVPSSPMPVITCNAPLEIPPYYYDPNYSGSGTTGGTGSTGGGNCSGSGCINQGSGSGALSGFDEFIDYVTDCDLNDDNEISIGEGLFCPITVVGKFIKGTIDRLSSAWSYVWGIIENLMKLATPTDTGTGSVFGFSLIETANADSDNPMVNAVREQVHKVATNENPFGKFVDFMWWGVIFALVIVSALLFAKTRK